LFPEVADAGVGRGTKGQGLADAARLIRAGIGTGRCSRSEVVELLVRVVALRLGRVVRGDSEVRRCAELHILVHVVDHAVQGGGRHRSDVDRRAVCP
jgi:hypothetical protein